MSLSAQLKRRIAEHGRARHGTAANALRLRREFASLTEVFSNGEHLMTISKALYSSRSEEWPTPQQFFGFLASFPDARKFQTLVTKFGTEDEYFGPVKLSALWFVAHHRFFLAFRSRTLPCLDHPPA